MTDEQPTIVLVGLMGAGKSTIGRLLAKLLRTAFYDTDQLIEERTGADIAWIFDVEGEAGFRDREQAMLAELLAADSEAGAVIATGGGIVEREANRQLLKQCSQVVYLRANIEQLITRTAKDKKRPLLQVADPAARITELFERRDPLYQQVASHTVTTDKRSPKLVAEQIVALLGQ